MPVNWKDHKAFERLLAAMVAAQEMKLDYRRIATMYGQDATYDSIEGRFRIIKKQAQTLLSEITSGQRPSAPPRGSKPSFHENGNAVTPKKNARKPRAMIATQSRDKKGGDNGDKVLGGRVSKNVDVSPRKVKKGGAVGVVGGGIKEETVDDGDEGVVVGAYEEEMDVGGVAEGLGLDESFGAYGGGFEMEV
ncbi:MAG: hypothetical protein Q9186_006595 [Xanthomendoza sp. 1 TL-2023]